MSKTRKEQTGSDFSAFPFLDEGRETNVAAPSPKTALGFVKEQQPCCLLQYHLEPPEAAGTLSQSCPWSLNLGLISLLPPPPPDEQRRRAGSAAHHRPSSQRPALPPENTAKCTSVRAGGCQHRANGAAAWPSDPTCECWRHQESAGQNVKIRRWEKKKQQKASEPEINIHLWAPVLLFTIVLWFC